MTLNGILQIIVFFLAVLALTKPLGLYMAKVYSGEKTFADRVVGPFERLLYKVCRIDPKAEQRWTTYTFAMLAFSLVSLVVLYLQMRFQAGLGLNPQNLSNVPPDLAFNTAVSFTTNTNWQASHFTISPRRRSGCRSRSRSFAASRGGNPKPSATFGLI
jgi:potassium-transporting ATPase potassium-binding subunit